ncbi:MAG: VWA domain-containing protein [candidate division Zixibacteria bacterium]|nr:VWA domain-containing protein [candidate division Zixibacteria bacterium]
MWSFLNPAALFGLFAAGIPLILHLLSRRRVKIVEFSSIEFLNKMKQTKMRYVRLKEIILLIIRTLIIIFLVLAFSRPTYRGMIGESSGPSSTVILLDDSYSMSQSRPSGSLFDLGKSKILEMLENIQPGDNISVLPFSETINPKFRFLSPDPDYFTKILPGLNTTYDTTNPIGAIESAIKLLNESENLNKEIVILSDFNPCGWSSGDAIREVIEGFKGNILIYDIHSDEVNNALIQSVDFGGKIIQPGIGFDISASIKNSSNRRLDKLLMDLYIDKTRISQAELSFNPNETGQVNLRANISSIGVHSGFVEIQDDDILADNRYYFSFKIPETIKILLAGSDSELMKRISLSIAPSNMESTHFKIDQADISRILSIGIGDYDAAIFPDFSPNKALMTRIKEFVESGKGVFIIPSAGIEIEALNVDLASLSIPIKINNEIKPGKDSYFALEKLNTKHPIFSIYHSKNIQSNSTNLPEIKFNSIYNFEINGRVEIPAELTGGKPLLFCYEKLPGIIVVSAASFSPNISDISSSSVFLPMIMRTTEYITSGIGTIGQSYQINESIRYNLSRDIPSGKVEIIAPDGERSAVQPLINSSGSMIEYLNSSQPGIYYIQIGGKIISAFTVNVDIQESRPGYLSEDELTKLIPGDNLIIANTSDKITDSLRLFRIGKEFTSAGFSIVLILLVIEMLIAGRWRSHKGREN